MSDERQDGDQDLDSEESDADEMDALIARALVDKGELIPTTSAEVRSAQERHVAFVGELPESLRELDVSKSDTAKDDARPAASRRVVSIDELSRARSQRNAGRLGYVATFTAGLAVAAAVALIMRPSTNPNARHDQGAGPSPSGTASSEPATSRVIIAAVHGDPSECCAGSACASAKGELRSCASGRTNVACSDTTPKGASKTSTAYRVRLGNVVPAAALAATSLAALDVCGRVLGGDWSCVPAYAEPSATPSPRSLGKLVSSSDLANGLEIELRTRFTGPAPKPIPGAPPLPSVARWHDSVRIGPTVLCRGMGALLVNDKSEDQGSLAIMFDDPYYVELARDADVAALKTLRADLDFSDVVPEIVETNDPTRRFALAVGPLDVATADKLKWALVDRSRSANVTLDDGYRGSREPLPR